MATRREGKPLAAWPGRAPGIAASCCVGVLSLPGCAAPADAAERFSTHIQDGQFVSLALILGLALLSAALAAAHLVRHGAWAPRETARRAELERLRAKLDRAEAFLAAEPHAIISWDGAAGPPEIEGGSLLEAEGESLLAFESWLAPAVAEEMAQKLERLKFRGEAFQAALPGPGGRRFEADGRAIGGRASLRIREVSGDRFELSSLRERHAQVAARLEGLEALLEALPAPVWMRDENGRLVFVNSAYARAAGAGAAADVLERQTELLDAKARKATREGRSRGAVWRERASVEGGGEQRNFDVVEAPWKGACAAIAFDRSEIDELRESLGRQIRSYAGALAQLPIAVAIFDRTKRLLHRNPAYERFWGLDGAFLDRRPSDGEILDRLRAEHKLPAEEADYKAWKSRLLDAYQSCEACEFTWHMPDERTFHVAVNPGPDGGATYFYNDVSWRYNLESRFNALARMQSETLEALREGVAVFGTDGRLKFSNPAFAELWRLETTDLEKKPRFDAVADLCRALHQDEGDWDVLRGFVTGLPDMRSGFTRRIERRDGAVLDCGAQPLPEGAALLTFVDVTSDARIEQALKESNRALRAAEKIRNDFIQLVSYELRSPLTNIIGFVHLLAEASGEMNAKQLEYLGYVRKSSRALLAIVDDILDLATIDRNAMELELEEVDIARAMRTAAEGMADRFAENSIELQIVATGWLGSFRADARRIRQILFNLLANAIAGSRPGQAVALAALRRENEVVFKVTDRGPGLPAEAMEKILGGFESRAESAGRRGRWLGLNVVRSFTELHGGKFLIDSAPGEGTTVTCIFPAREPEALGRADAREGECAS